MVGISTKNKHAHVLVSLCGLLIITAVIANPQVTFRSDVNLVTILATARDSNGKIVTTLTKDDFILKEDGQPQPIHDFAAQSDLPLSLGLLVDTSGSMHPVLNAEGFASHEFLKGVLRPDADKAFVIRFDTEVVMLSALDDSRKHLAKALDNIVPDPLLDGCSGLHRVQRRAPPPSTMPSLKRLYI